MTRPLSDTTDFDPNRPVITLGDARLTQFVIRDTERCASVSEYADATGMDPQTVLELLGPWLDNGTVRLDICGDEFFLHTAPHGRPGPAHVAYVPANLWEQLRDVAPPEVAVSLWRLVRSLQRAGWQVETKPSRIMFGLAPVTDRPFMGVRVAQTVVPLLILPTPDALASPTGLLAEYERAGAAMVGVVCENSSLDETVTAVRRWSLTRPTLPTLGVLVLEAPRYEPVYLAMDDAGIEARSVTRLALERLQRPLPS